jgi:hypothetical protein
MNLLVPGQLENYWADLQRMLQDILECATCITFYADRNGYVFVAAPASPACVASFFTQKMIYSKLQKLSP